MTRRFIIATEGMTQLEEAAFIRYLKDEKRVGWWHHIAGFWLVVDRQNKVDAVGIRDSLKSIRATTAPTLVMEVHDDITWAGLNRPGTTATFEWLSTQWTDA